MALISITIERFRGKDNATYNFSPGLNIITGQNGTGKTTIREAIVFGFTGTDSLGARNPSHLISNDKEDTKVTVRTTKAELVRTLTRKGNGTFKVVKNGVASTMTQTQLESMMGSIDLFLSCFIPNFFLGLSTERQHKVISEIMPKIDRNALFTEIAGFELSPEEKLRYSLSRRSDLLISDVAKDRREMEKQAQVKQGEINSLEGLKPLPLPLAGSGSDIIARMDILKTQWEQYKRDSAAYTQASLTTDRVRDENDRKAKRRDEITAQLKTLPATLVKPEYKPVDIEIIRNEMIRQPAEPALMGTVDSENCPTCSQVVSLKHRERVRLQNEEILAKYHEEDAKVLAHNDAIQDRIRKAQTENDKLKQDYLSAIDNNNKNAASRQRLEIELTQLKDVEFPALPPIPIAPEEPFDQETYAVARKEVDDYKAALAQYDYVRTQAASAEAKINEARKLITEVTLRTARLQSIEEALKVLPQKELEKQTSSFEIGNVKLHVGSEITAFVDGKPVKLLSTGTEMKAGVAVARKLDSLNPRPIGMVFLDNADLVDVIDLSNCQAFLAKVVKDQLEVRIEVDNNNN